MTSSASSIPRAATSWNSGTPAGGMKRFTAPSGRPGSSSVPAADPRLPDELIRTADEVYIRLHGPKRWYRHDYSKEELAIWADRIKASGAKRAWVYFNNDNDAHAPKNATTLRRMLGRSFRA